MNNKKVFIVIVFAIAITMAFGFQNSSEHKVLFEKAKFTMETKGDLKGAIKLFEQIIQKYPDQREYAAKSQLYIGLCYEKLGLKEAKQAQKAFQKVVDKYPEQTEAVKLAREKLSVLLRAQAVIEKGDKKFKMRKVWEGLDVGELSPDGKYFSFSDRNTGNLAIREIATGKTRSITKKKDWSVQGFAADSIWSPDGKRLAYAWYNKDNDFDLRIIWLDGSKQRILYQEKDEWVFPADWSPDEKYILAYLVREYYKTSQIGLISVEDGSLRVLKTLKSYPSNMSFSPDGRYIVLDQPQQEDTPEHDVFMLSIDGKREIPIVEHPADDRSAFWIPDGKRILFGSDRTGTWDAWIIAVEEGKPKGDPELVKKEIGQISPLGFTNKGSFYYSQQTGMVDVYIATLDLEKDKIIAPPKKLAQRFIGSNYSPDWSPDGKYLAYISERRARLEGIGSHVLCIRSDKTGEVRELIPELTSFGRLCWAPDCRSIFVTGSEKKVNLGLYRIDVQTGDKFLIAKSETGANIKDFTFSLDGKSVFYAYFEWPKKLARILMHDLETGQEKEVYRKVAPPDIGKLTVSPDGKYLAFITAEPGWPWFVRAIPIDSGEPRDLVKMKSNGTVTYVWTPDGKQILFIKDVSNEKEQISELWRMSAEGGEPKKICLAMERMRRLRIHPDGRRIAFISGKENAEIWVMENFLPEAKQKKKSKLRQ